MCNYDAVLTDVFVTVHAQECVQAAGMRGCARRRGGHQAPLLLQVHQLGRHGEPGSQAAVQA